MELIPNDKAYKFFKHLISFRQHDLSENEFNFYTNISGIIFNLYRPIIFSELVAHYTYLKERIKNASASNTNM